MARDTVTPPVGSAEPPKELAAQSATLQQPDRCPSCGALRGVNYCTYCGERFLDSRDLQFAHFVRKHLIHNFFDVDGRVARTMRSLLMRPGELAVNFMAGRRQGFTSPLRLYLVVFLVVVFVETVFFPTTATTLPELAKHIDPTGFVNRLIASRPNVDWSNEALNLRLGERYRWFGEIVLFLFPVGVAIVQALVFRKPRRTYVEHLVLAITVQAWFLVMVIFGLLLIALLWRHSAPYASPMIREWIALFGLPVYWVLAIRRFYGLRLWPAVATGLVVTVGNWFVAILLNVLVLGALVLTA